MAYKASVVQIHMCDQFEKGEMSNVGITAPENDKQVETASSY